MAFLELGFFFEDVRALFWQRGGFLFFFSPAKMNFRPLPKWMVPRGGRITLQDKLKVTCLDNTTGYVTG